MFCWPCISMHSFKEIPIWCAIYLTVYCAPDNGRKGRPKHIEHKVIQKNQLDATIIYWSIRSAQHVSGNLLPIIRRVRLRFLQHMVTCCRWAAAWHCVHIVPRCRSPTPCPPQKQVTICCKNLKSHAPDDGQNIARNMLSWSYRSINYCCI